MKIKYFSKFVNLLSKNGNTIKSRKLLLDCLFTIKLKGHHPVEVFIKAIKAVLPLGGLKKYSRRNKTFYKLKLISHDQRLSLGIKWIIEGAYIRKNNFCDSLAIELIDASRCKGFAYNKKISIIDKI